MPLYLLLLATSILYAFIIRQVGKLILNGLHIA